LNALNDVAQHDIFDPVSHIQQDGSKMREAPPPGKVPFVIAAVILISLLAYGGYTHSEKKSAAEKTRIDSVNFVPTVHALTVKRIGTPITITLPGETRPFDTAKIFSRATGYIVERRVDIGSRVKKGDLMLRIAAPDVDAQEEQAKAQLGQMEALVVQSHAMVEQAQAGVDLAKVTNSRISKLAGQGWATQQNADTTHTGVASNGATLAAASAGVKVAEANVKAQKATVVRLSALRGFEDVLAPFDGVVSQRMVDIGDLVHADSVGNPLLVLDRDDVLRASVNIPQATAMGIADGLGAIVQVPQMSGRSFSGKVARSSVALLYSSRTLTTQVDIPNADHALRAGLFVDVTIAVPRTEVRVSVPAEALMFNEGGMQVAILDDQGKVLIQSVRIDRDLGTTVEIKDGLVGGEQLVVSPPADLHSGSKVNVEPQETTRRTASE
jgi:HlyD family secretion protein